MNKTEILSRIESNLNECEGCGLAYDPQTSFVRIPVVNEEKSPATIYLAGKCPHCGTPDQVLFEWSNIELAKEIYKKEK